MTVIKIELSVAWWVRPAVRLLAIAAALGVRMDVEAVATWVCRRGIVVKRAGKP